MYFLQIDITREPANRKRGSWGNVQFSAKMFRDDFGGSVGFFGNFIYPLPALQPVYPWLSNSTFSKVETMQPIILKSKERSSITVNVTITKDIITSGIVHKLAIYKHATEGQWTLYKVIPGEDIPHPIQLVTNGKYAATFVNRLGQESRKTFFKFP